MRFSFGKSTPAIRAKTFLLAYPWRCLWRGFLQMMRTTPLRRTTLQCSQILVTDALTFIACSLLVSVDDPPARQIVGRELHRHFVSGQNLDEVHAHLARDMRQHFVAVLQLHAKHRVRERLDDGSLDLDAFFFCHSSNRPRSWTRRPAHRRLSRRYGRSAPKGFDPPSRPSTDPIGSALPRCPRLPSARSREPSL